jgi:hypothetical protein
VGRGELISRKNMATYNFDHFADALPLIKSFKKERNHDKLEELLLWCVNSTEADARRNGWGVAPYYYLELAILHRKRRDYASEVKILERFEREPRGDGAMVETMSQRLIRARSLLAGER